MEVRVADMTRSETLLECPQLGSVGRDVKHGQVKARVHWMNLVKVGWVR